MAIEIDMHKSNVFVASILIIEAKLWLSRASNCSMSWLLPPTHLIKGFAFTIYKNFYSVSFLFLLVAQTNHIHHRLGND